MAFPSVVTNVLDPVLAKNLRLTQRFGGQVGISWKGQTLFVNLPHHVPDPKNCWMDNQAVQFSAKYSRPKSSWTVVVGKGVQLPPKCSTETLVKALEEVFAVAKGGA